MARQFRSLISNIILVNHCARETLGNHREQKGRNSALSAINNFAQTVPQHKAATSPLSLKNARYLPAQPLLHPFPRTPITTAAPKLAKAQSPKNVNAQPYPAASTNGCTLYEIAKFTHDEHTANTTTSSPETCGKQSIAYAVATAHAATCPAIIAPTPTATVIQCAPARAPHPYKP